MSKKTITLEQLKQKLAQFPHIKLDSASKVSTDKLLEYLRNGQVRICNHDDSTPYCRFEYVVVRVFHNLNDKYSLELVETKTHSSNHLLARPMEGINTKIFHGENVDHAAHRALRDKLGIARFDHLEPRGSRWDVLKNGTGIPGLFTKNLIHLFHFHMQKGMYVSEGYTIRRGTDRKVVFKWVPMNNRVHEEHQILP